jgi:hypothetical protein
MGRPTTSSSLGPKHNRMPAIGFTHFRLLYGSEAMTPQEIKHGSPRTSTSAVPDVDEPTSKDLIDGDRVLALHALIKYQAQTKA